MARVDRVLFTGLVVLLASCGSGSGGSGGSAAGSGTSGPTQPSPSGDDLDITITFPLPQSQMRGVDQIIVSGTVANLTDQRLEPADVSRLEVNGQRATVDLATGRWSATVTAANSPLTLNASVTTTGGKVARDQVSVFNTPDPLRYEALGIVPDDGRVLVYGSGRLRTIDPSTGTETTLSTQLGPSVTAVRVGPSNTAYMLREGNDNNVLRGLGVSDAVAVNLSDGDTRVVGALPQAERASDEYRYNYPDFAAGTRQIAYTFRADIADSPASDCSLGFLDIASGERIELLRTDSFDYIETDLDPDTIVGITPALSLGPTYEYLEIYHCPGAVVIDERRNRTVTAEFPRSQPVEGHPYQGLYTHDLNTGEFGVLADDKRGTGPVLQRPQWLFMRGSGDSVIAIDSQGIYDVDLSTGNRTLLSGLDNWPEFIGDLQFDETNNRLLYTRLNQVIGSIDLSTGAQRELLTYSLAVGSGPDVHTFQPLLVDEANHRLLRLDLIDNNIISIDLQTLRRTATPLELPEGDGISDPVLHSNGSVVYYYSRTMNSVMALNLETGKSSTVVELSPADADGSERPWSMALDSDNGLLYLSMAKGIFSVDVVTGAMQAVTDDAVGVQEFLLFDPGNSRLIGLRSSPAFVEIDLGTGRYEQLRGQESGEFRHRVQYVLGATWDTRAGHILLEGRSIAESIVSSVNPDTGEFALVAKDRGNIATHTSAGLMFSSRAGYSTWQGTFEALERTTGQRAIIVRPD